jgi:hypothetical protein
MSAEGARSALTATQKRRLKKKAKEEREKLAPSNTIPQQGTEKVTAALESLELEKNHPLHEAAEECSASIAAVIDESVVSPEQAHMVVSASGATTGSDLTTVTSSARKVRGSFVVSVSEFCVACREAEGKGSISRDCSSLKTRYVGTLHIVVKVDIDHEPRLSGPSIRINAQTFQL